MTTGRINQVAVLAAGPAAGASPAAAMNGAFSIACSPDSRTAPDVHRRVGVGQSRGVLVEATCDLAHPHPSLPVRFPSRSIDVLTGSAVFRKQPRDCDVCHTMP